MDFAMVPPVWAAAKDAIGAANATVAKSTATLFSFFMILLSRDAADQTA